MKVKRFIAKDSRTAMSQVRSEFGADAVILSNKTVGNQVELVAAIDLDESAFAASEPTPVAGQGQSHSQGQPAPAAEVDSIALSQLQRELGNLRSMIEGKFSQLAWKDMAGRPSAKAALQARLSGLGLSRSLSGVITDILPTRGDVEEYWQLALDMLATRLQVVPEDSLMETGGIVALMGVTGVGKTTTIAKLAARFAQRHGSHQVALITTDCYRIGGQEQLQTFAGYIGVPVLVATDSSQLQAALDRMASRRLILIDTPGMSQRDARLYEQYSALKSVGHAIDVYAVLPATAQLGALRELVRMFGEGELAGAMLTKLDESVGLGGVLDVLIENSLPLAYVSDGQNVPEDLKPAHAESLVARAVELAIAEASRESRDGNNAATQSVMV